MGDTIQEDFSEVLAELQSQGEQGGGSERTPAEGSDQGGEVSAGEQQAEKPSRSRDSSGKFAPKSVDKGSSEGEVALPPRAKREEAAAEKPGLGKSLQQQEGTKSGEIAAPAPPPARGAPASWKPEEREHWSTMTPAAQAAVIRREREVDEVLRTSATARQLHSEFERVVAPYAHMIQSEGATPMSAVSELLRTAAQLRSSSGPEKAALVANMVRQFGVDIEQLDNALVNGPAAQKPSGVPSDVLQAVRQEFGPVVQFVQQLQNTSQTQTVESARQAWEAFANDPQYEYANDVKTEIAAILRAYSEMGQVIPLPDAYQMATMRHPTISKILERRRTETDVTQQTEAARRAREAAVSLPSSGAPLQGDDDQGDGTIESDVRQAVRSLSRGR